MALADARAIDPDLTTRPADLAAEAAALAAPRRWTGRSAAPPAIPANRRKSCSPTGIFIDGYEVEGEEASFATVGPNVYSTADEHVARACCCSPTAADRIANAARGFAVDEHRA